MENCAEKSVRKPPLKFRRRADARPDEVLDAARDLFTKSGFAAARMEDIAAKAGISKATIYLYFANKEALLEALVKRAIVPNIRQVHAALDSFPGTPTQALALLLGVMEQTLADPQIVALPMLVLREGGAFPSIAAMYRREVIDQIRPVFSALFQRGVNSGDFRPADADLALRSVIGPVLANAVLTRLFGIGRDDAVAHATFFGHHRDYLAHGLLTDPGARL